MKRQAYQRPEIRDANDNIIQEGTYGKESPLVNSDNTGVLDYINNNLEALRDNINGSRVYVKNKDALPTPGDISAIYITEDTGKWYLWDGQKYIETDNARKIADEAIAARDAAKASANDAANSAREQQADWNVTDSTSKAFIKNKPEVVTYKQGAYQEVMEWKSNCVQSIADGMATDHPNAHNYGVQVTLGKIGQGGNARIYFPHKGGGMFLKNFWGTGSQSGWLTMLNDKNFSLYALPKDGTAVKATADAAGNNIQNTYVKKSDLASSLSTKALTVTGETSVPTANAGNSSNAIASTEFVAKSIASLVGSAPDQLNTLNELAKALGNDSNFAATMTAELAKKLNSTEAESTYLPLSGGTLSGTITTTANPGLKVRGNDSYLVLCGASSYEHGAHMLLNGENRPNNEGTFGIVAVANDGSGSRVILTGKPDGTLTWGGQPLLPVGVVQAFAGTTIPSGWLLCDGSAVSRTTYASLYACIGTTYGTGNGSTTFNLPNLVDKFVEGSATAGTVKSAGLPNITGEMYNQSGRINATDQSAGAFKDTDPSGAVLAGADSGSYGYGRTITFDASRSNSIYGNSNTVQPPSVTMRYIIKY